MLPPDPLYQLGKAGTPQAPPSSPSPKIPHPEGSGPQLSPPSQRQRLGPLPPNTSRRAAPSLFLARFRGTGNVKMPLGCRGRSCTSLQCRLLPGREKRLQPAAPLRSPPRSRPLVQPLREKITSHACVCPCVTPSVCLPVCLSACVRAAAISRRAPPRPPPPRTARAPHVAARPGGAGGTGGSDTSTRAPGGRGAAAVGGRVTLAALCAA